MDELNSKQMFMIQIPDIPGIQIPSRYALMTIPVKPSCENIIDILKHRICLLMEFGP